MSTNDFLDLVKIKTITERTFNHPNLPLPKISQEILKKMLTLCTRELAFIAPNGHLYRQVNGMAMRSPLGPTFANYYMSHIENLVFNTYPNIKPLV